MEFWLVYVCLEGKYWAQLVSGPVEKVMCHVKGYSVEGRSLLNILRVPKLSRLQELREGIRQDVKTLTCLQSELIVD